MIFSILLGFSCVLGVFSAGGHNGVPLRNSYDFKIPATIPPIVRRIVEPSEPAAKPHHFKGPEHAAKPHHFKGPEHVAKPHHYKVPEKHEFTVYYPTKPLSNSHEFPLHKPAQYEVHYQKPEVKPHEVYGVPPAFQDHSFKSRHH